MPLSAEPLSIYPSHKDGVYRADEPIAWHVTGDLPADETVVTYTVLSNGKAPLLEGELDLATGRATITVPAGLMREPGSLLLKVRATRPDHPPTESLGGAVVEPEAIRPLFPKPSDFDTFWDEKLERQRALPFDIQLEEVDSGRPDVLLQTVSLRSLDGSRARAQIARPRAGTHFPAIVILQWAGVYGLSKETVTSMAAKGWLAMNVMPHDLPLYEAPSFYEAQKSGPLQNFGVMENHDREHAYLTHMVLRAARAVAYLASRPDWDTQTLIATGTSMGGFQALAVAALDPRVSRVAANVPAVCEQSGPLRDRSAPWPYWMKHQPEEQPSEAIHQAGRYVDGVNFASRIRVPVLVSAGLIDTSCPPTGILALASQLQGPKDIILMPRSPHQDPHHAFHEAAARLLAQPPQPPTGTQGHPQGSKDRFFP